MEKRLPTIKEIAKQLNISVSTVSRALHDHPSIGLRTKTRVQQLAEQLGYEPNQAAISFKQRKTFTIGVVLPNLKEEFFSNAISGIEDVATENKYNVLIGQSHDDVEREKQIITAMKNQRVDGLIVSLSKHTKDYSHFLALEKYNIPIVFFDRVPSLQNVNKVSFNMESGTREAIEFLVSKGHRRIGILNGPEEMKSSRERTETFKQMLVKMRLKIDLSLVVNTDLTRESTEMAMEQLLNLKPRPTAVLAINDYVALDAIQYVRRKGLTTDKDIAFVSYANLPITTYLQHPPMASVEQYPYEQGSKAASILMEAIHHNNSSETLQVQNITIDGKLVIHQKESR